MNGDSHYQQLRQRWNSRSEIDEVAGKETSITIVDTKMGQIGEESRWCQTSGGEPAHKRNEKSEVSAKEIIKGGDEVIGASKNCNSGDEIFFQEQQTLNEGFKWVVGEIGGNEMWKGRAQEQRIEPEIKSGLGLLEGKPNPTQQNHGTIWADLKNNSGLKRKVDEDEQGGTLKKQRALGLIKFSEIQESNEAQIQNVFNIGMISKEKNLKSTGHSRDGAKATTRIKLKRISREGVVQDLKESGIEDEEHKRSFTTVSSIPEVHMAEEAGLHMPHPSP